MKHLLAALLVALALATPAYAQAVRSMEDMSIEELAAEAPNLHPAGLYVLAARLLAQGEGQAAANWMYAGQLRYRFLLEVEGQAGSDHQVLFSALSEQVGRPINEYIGGNVDEWLAAIDWALEWDVANPNGLLSKTEHADALATTREGLIRLRAQVEENRETIPQQRAANGLENR